MPEGEGRGGREDAGRGVIPAFRFKPGICVPYERQGVVYFTSRTYRDQPERVKRKIEGLCRTCAGEYWRALFEFVTTDESATKICMEHYIGRATLFRAVKKYYESF